MFNKFIRFNRHLPRNFNLKFKRFNSNSSYQKTNYSRKSKYIFGFSTLFIGSTILTFNNPTFLLQSFFKVNDVLVSEDVKLNLIYDYMFNNLHLKNVQIGYAWEQTEQVHIEYDWKNGFIQINNLSIKLDNDNIFFIKKLKFNISLYRYFFKKNEPNSLNLIDMIEADGVKGKMNTNTMLNYNFDMNNNIKVRNCKLAINQRHELVIFQLELNKLSNKSFLLDLMNCEILSGEFDKSLFTIVEKQPHMINDKIQELNEDLKNSWEKISRLQFNKININKLNLDKFDWIYDGDVEFVMDLMIPKMKDTSSANSNNPYLVLDISVKLHNPKCRTKSKSKNLKISNHDIKQIADALNKNLPENMTPLLGGMHIYNETLEISNTNQYDNTSNKVKNIKSAEHDENVHEAVGYIENYSNMNDTVVDTDYTVPLNCKILVDPDNFVLETVYEKITDEFYTELKGIAEIENAYKAESNKKWEVIMVGLLAQALIVGLGTFN
ncbi:hypothetical protein ACO0R3_003128 [Hanseniaspora guilliermondii]